MDAQQAEKLAAYEAERDGLLAVVDGLNARADVAERERDRLTADLAAERRISERMRESRDRVIGQRDMLLAEITDGGFCKLCDGFGPDGYPIVHRESCPTRFEYRALAADARRDGPEG